MMKEGDDVKLIDVGGMCLKDDANGNIYGTRGYMAPEADQNPIEVSDLYTIGRTLATMLFDFGTHVEVIDGVTYNVPNFTSTNLHSLPSPSEQPVLAQNDSLYRFLLRACHPDPDQRFQSAEEMGDQLYGVLREIVSISSAPHPMDSLTFTQDNLIDGDDFSAPCYKQLPALKMSQGDKAASELMAAAMIADPFQRVIVLQDIYTKKGKKSPESGLRLIDAFISVAKYTEARKLMDAMFAADPFDWRVSWYLGKSFLAQGMPDDAKLEFGKVYFEMPGELAPKLAIAYALEMEGKLDEAITFYGRVAKVDPNNTSACIGLARCHQHQNDVAAISASLNSVPQVHMLYTRSRIILANTLMTVKDVSEPIIDEIAKVIGEIPVDHSTFDHLSARFYEMVVGKLKAGTIKESAKMLLGNPISRKHIAAASEHHYRKAARHAVTAADRISLVDRANAIGPRRLV
jgi:serine/threonine-protein kinase PknG